MGFRFQNSAFPERFGNRAFELQIWRFHSRFGARMKPGDQCQPAGFQVVQARLRVRRNPQATHHTYPPVTKLSFRSRMPAHGHDFTVHHGQSDRYGNNETFQKQQNHSQCNQGLTASQRLKSSTAKINLRDRPSRFCQYQKKSRTVTKMQKTG
jgi:hypothetical protein